MKWIIDFFSSNIGRKLIMSLTGIFLITFLPVHLAGNLLLLSEDGGEAFNVYAKFMTSNPLIKTVSIGLYVFIVLHAAMGLILAYNNRKAKGKKYTVTTSANATFAAKQMALLGTFILAFILIHMGDFWFKMKTGSAPMITYAGEEYQNLYFLVTETFSNPVFVIIYVIGMITLSFHLWHGFQSAFQTLGINHKKYTPIISFLGKAYSIIIPFAFAVIPVYMYLVILK